MGGGNTNLQSSPNADQGGVNINRQLREAQVFMALYYHNPNPWVRILDRANEYKIEIDGIKSKALIDSGAMISMMSKEYCDTHGYEIQPLDSLVLIEAVEGQMSLFGAMSRSKCESQGSALPNGMFLCLSVIQLLIIINGYQFKWVVG